ncbi:hypothetical protein R1flu_005030 [Riccia fluitans]|uniref:Uncharacterized protein n=1 Tax=Riccia fluitans TaxID=41844 RepID=A0ABD1YS03_9MARC
MQIVAEVETAQKEEAYLLKLQVQEQEGNGNVEVNAPEERLLPVDEAKKALSRLVSARGVEDPLRPNKTSGNRFDSTEGRKRYKPEGENPQMEGNSNGTPEALKEARMEATFSGREPVEQAK